MSQILCPKNYLVTNKDMTSSHPIFWSQRRSLPTSSDLISWSYPPKKDSFCAKLLTQISAQLNDFQFTKTSFVNPLKLRNNSSAFEELFPSKIIRRMTPKTSSVTCFEPNRDSTSGLGEEVFFSDQKSNNNNNNNNNTRIQVISDSNVLHSMQNDRQKKQNRKRRKHRKRKSKPKAKTDEELISVFLLEELSSDTDQSEDSNWDQLELQELCRSFYFDYFFSQSSVDKSCDEIDFCPQMCPQIASEEEMTSNEIKEANEKWNQSYEKVCSEEKDPKDRRVRFSAQKPKVKVLRVWDFASRSARCGQWEQMRRDRERFGEKCKQLEQKIGYVFSEEHRERQYRLRFGINE